MTGDQRVGHAGAATGVSPRLVLLGASNLARCLDVIVTIGQQMCAASQRRGAVEQHPSALGSQDRAAPPRPALPGLAPLEVLAALGRGRSYGAEHCFLGRRMPGIVDCGVWAALEQSSSAPTSALVTDIGNDIVYGRSAESIAGWVETCLARLHAAGARVVMTRLPVDNLHTLSPGRFLFFRRLFFPNSPVTLSEVKQQAFALDERVIELGRRHGVPVVGHETAWYGVDPIHIRRSIARAAWSKILGPLAAENGATAGATAATGAMQPATSDSPAAPLGYRDRLGLLRMKPAEYRRGARVYRVAQPAGVLRSGAIVSLF